MVTRTPGFLAGLRGVLDGIRFVAAHPRLWTWIALPVATNAAIFLGLAALGWQAAHALQADLATASWGWFDALRAFLAPVIGVALLLVSVLAAFLATLLLSGVVNAPFHDILSERVQRLVEGRAEDGRPWSALLPDAWAALRAALSLALLQAALLAPLFLLSFTAVGAPLFAAAGFLFTGFGLADVTLARWRLDAPARRRWARRRAGLLTGLGAPVSLLPPLAPFGVVGATLLCVRIAAEEASVSRADREAAS
ncbi:MAG TPA: EI24 domain-containing protein [Planctomycetota bacterium]|nr:EI24 domain-containing protein [Planctomycetota bacterium]